MPPYDAGFRCLKGIFATGWFPENNRLAKQTRLRHHSPRLHITINKTNTPRQNTQITGPSTSLSSSSSSVILPSTDLTFSDRIDQAINIMLTKSYSTHCSRVVPHLSTEYANICLTAEIGRDPVLSDVYGHN